MVRRALPVTVLAAALGAGGALAVSASGRPAHASTTRLTLRAVESGGKLRFSKTRLTARRGLVRITMSNPSGNKLPHAVEISGKGIEKKSKVVGPGGRAAATARLRRAGRYTFYCPVDGHRKAGMKGTLIVR
jgi:plastocyanin